MAGAIQGQTYLITNNLLWGIIREYRLAFHQGLGWESLGGGRGRNNVPLESVIIFQKL